MNSQTPPSLLAIVLTAIGGVAVGYGLFTDGLVHRATWVVVLALLSLGAWILRSIVGRFGFGAVDFALCVLAALAGGLVAAPTNGLGVIPAAVSIMVVIGQIERPMIVGVAMALVTIVLVAFGALPYGTPVLAVLGMIGGVVLGVFAGISRRQFRQAEEQSRRLRERELDVRAEKARVDLLGQRQEVARDIHDVLAHSLGGLVIQLDAVEALLEAGDVPSAQRRVTDARRLAADGLGEARRAVAALRDPAAAAVGPEAETAVEPSAFEATIGDLLGAHRSLGGPVDLEMSGPPRPLGRAEAVALQRAVQEGLSNARKHAPGQPVRVGLAWEDGRVTLTVSNPAVDPGGSAAGVATPAAAPGAAPVERIPLAATGGGHGLDGMRERFAALPFGGSAAAHQQGDRFVLRATAVTAAPAAPAAPGANAGDADVPAPTERA
ncbi:sensor histidine kinase [Leifsonia sp. NPDC058292]|uniref:sensor histidine kinase n=1 Tax=Leifsonia sp. NPDC058292 TaxID=3346428 RepID=UPI0036DE59C2